ncbi:MAG: ATP-dependent DNA helicase RecG [Candidatus Omnitrophica bacterium]|nr:ATP-dependent DNA helicase RecG [Candidatus Omnitrophota bacterium]MBU1869443.1 ATP-dependent DNA helicase RecG [Candidatus Omnitrophota bacterium]
MKNSVDTSIQYLKGIGPKRAKAFAAVGIKTVEDLLYYFPRRYEDRTKFSPISKLQEGTFQTIKAQVLVKGKRSSFRRRGFSITEVIVGDETGKISCVWFNQPYLSEYFKVGQSVILYGRVQRYGAKLQMNSPEFELALEQEPLSTGRIVPVYSLPQRVGQRTMRALVKSALDEYLGQITDCLPYDIRARNNLLNLATSLISIHFPENESLRLKAFERLSFEEFFIFQLPLAMRKLNKKEKKGLIHKTEGKLIDDFLSNLTFELTASQQNVLKEIKKDMSGPLAMQRLLQGDVGCGKTVVAACACVIAAQGGYQAAFMAPTEILARQHYEKIKSQVSSLKSEVRIGLLTSSVDIKEKENISKDICEGKIDLVIGTHALLEEGVEFCNLGLVVIDEQHKFGVGQRALLPAKGANPDVLIMTATPIPRTLAITLYGDLDVSVINEMPKGRLPIKTLYFNEDEKRKAYAIARMELAKGNQAFIIYPVIDESVALDLAGAKRMFQELKSSEFKGFRLGLIHGRLDEKEQKTIMASFKDRKLDALISTTVLEVGIDIPNATCMIIEHAQRFGLSQLHQLRGRVGRGEKESTCILIADSKTEESKARIEAMVNFNDGFRIAEEDLKIRGPGEFFGSRQHGLTELKIANPLTQMHLLKRAREDALKLIASDQRLELRPNIQLKQKILQRFPEYEKLMLVG